MGPSRRARPAHDSLASPVQAQFLPRCDGPCLSSAPQLCAPAPAQGRTHAPAPARSPARRLQDTSRAAELPAFPPRARSPLRAVPSSVASASSKQRWPASSQLTSSRRIVAILRHCLRPPPAISRRRWGPGALCLSQTHPRLSAPASALPESSSKRASPASGLPLQPQRAHGRKHASPFGVTQAARVKITERSFCEDLSIPITPQRRTDHTAG